MGDAEPTTHTLDVPGARLYYDIRGSGPLLLLIGAPMDSAGFAAIASLLADEYTVVTYDPRGISRSTRDDPDADVLQDVLADDVHRLLSALGTEPAVVFGSSGGAITGLALVTGHPGQVHTLIAHEPPLIELLPDSAQLRSATDELHDIYRSDGPEAAMTKFFAFAGMKDPRPQSQPGPGEQERMRRNLDTFFGHMLRPFTRYRPDLPTLRETSTRIVVAAGNTSTGQLAHRTAAALAGELGTPLVGFPDGHGGFAEQPETFAEVLRQELTGKYNMLALAVIFANRRKRGLRRAGSADPKGWMSNYASAAPTTASTCSSVVSRSGMPGTSAGPTIRPNSVQPRTTASAPAVLSSRTTRTSSARVESAKIPFVSSSKTMRSTRSRSSAGGVITFTPR